MAVVGATPLVWGMWTVWRMRTVWMRAGMGEARGAPVAWVILTAEEGQRGLGPEGLALVAEGWALLTKGKVFRMLPGQTEYIPWLRWVGR